jgi:hypothetical protein
VPDAVELFMDWSGTPRLRRWYNKDRLSQVPGADDGLHLQGGSTAWAADTSSFSAYTGGDVVTAADVTAERYRKRDGTLYAAGDITEAGITIPAGDQTNSGINIGSAKLFSV